MGQFFKTAISKKTLQVADWRAFWKAVKNRKDLTKFDRYMKQSDLFQGAASKYISGKTR